MVPLGVAAVILHESVAMARPSVRPLLSVRVVAMLASDTSSSAMVVRISFTVVPISSNCTTLLPGTRPTPPSPPLELPPTGQCTVVPAVIPS